MGAPSNTNIAQLLINYDNEKFYKKLSSQEGYVDPEQYNQDFNLEPF